MNNWDSIKNGDRIELGLLQVDIAGHSKFSDNERILQKIKSLFRNQVEGIVKTRGGRLFNWAGDGGSFMFLTGDNDRFEQLVSSGLQILHNLPFINDEISTRYEFSDKISVRLSADCGMVIYHDDPAQISGKFINRFLKCERELSFSNTFSITKRVWNQLSNSQRQRFIPFKFHQAIESLIYNHGGKERQCEILRSLNNIKIEEGRQVPFESAEYVEIIAFQGDTLYELSKIAYEDVNVHGFDNVGALNLLTTKNSQICLYNSKPSENIQSNFEDELSPWELEHLHIILNKSSQRERLRIKRILFSMPKEERKVVIERASRFRTPDEFLFFLERFRKDPYSREFDPTKKFEGGEIIRFYNCAALGYLPLIGEGTLLDQVFANNLRICKVKGGVAEPNVKVRIFKLINGQYTEIQDTHKDGFEDK